MPTIRAPRTNRRSLCHGLLWLKQGSSRWAVLLCALLAGGSAGAFLFDPCWRLDRWGGNVEGHQAMLSDQSGDQISTEVEQQIIFLFAGFEPLAALFDYAPLQPNANDWHICRASAQLRANDGQSRALVFEQVSDSDLDLSVLIAQRHASHGLDSIWPVADHASSRFRIAFVIRRLYNFQNQFNSIVLFSCLRDVRNGTSVSDFGSISCPRPLVLRTYGMRTLVWARHSTQAQDRHCAGAVNAWQPLAELSAHPGWLTAVRCEHESLRCDPDGARSHPAAYYSPTCQKERRSLSAARSKERSLSAARSKERIAASDCSPVKYAPNQQRAQYATAHFSTETLDRLSSPTT